MGRAPQFLSSRAVLPCENLTIGTAPVLEARRFGQDRRGSAFSGDFLLVLAVKKEKKRAPQALAGGRKGTGKG